MVYSSACIYSVMETLRALMMASPNKLMVSVERRCS
jgi:hypothetical protein